jgi:phenylacetate-CoA ligase
VSGYYQQADPLAIQRDYPLGDGFLRGPARLSADALRALQEQRFAEVMARAWQVPFYRRRWREAGLEPGDIRGLDDLHLIPPYAKQDLMDSVERFPPLGDFHGQSDAHPELSHMVLHTTSGTTGIPQPIPYGARDREIQNALLARAYRLQGVRDDDVIQSVYGFGMVNGGHYVREAVLHYLPCLYLPAGTGIDTPSVTQIELMRRFRVTVAVGFADYLLKLAGTARDAGLDPAGDLALRMICGHVPASLREPLRQAWDGIEIFDWYGVGDTGIIAAEGPAADGLHIFEDAHLVEILDPDSQAPLPEGDTGNLCVTVLFKRGIYPIVRFNTQDLSARLPGGVEPVPAFGRISGFGGRSDNMVKLRGINVYPTAIGGMLGTFPEATGEYVCRVFTDGEGSTARDSMEVLVEWRAPADAASTETVAAHLRTRLGVAVRVRLVGAGETAALSEVDRRQKPRRLLDERNA